jgi:hypothetical protein
MACVSCGKSSAAGLRSGAVPVKRVSAPNTSKSIFNRLAVREVSSARMLVCSGCSHASLVGDTVVLHCGVAGVPCGSKVSLRDESCPLGFWTSKDTPANVEVESENHEIGSRREVCSKCTFKHLAYAYVALVEAEHGYPEHLSLAAASLRRIGRNLDSSQAEVRGLLDAKARAVGHLVHAMEECPDLKLASRVRTAYTAILDEKPHEDILNLIEQLAENK